MTIAETLHEYVAYQAEKLGLPVFFAGEALIAPASPYMRCSPGSCSAKAAGIGKFAPIRVDGKLELTLEILAGAGVEKLTCAAERVAEMFPYGLGLDYSGPQGNGEIVFSAPTTSEPETDAGRVRIILTIGFYAILFPEEK